MTEPKTVTVVVALVTNPDGKLLLSWNPMWGGFSLPMTKVADGPPAETVARAAVRAAAEVVGRPVRVANGHKPRNTRDLLLSARDKEVKNYVYTVVRVEVHPDFVGHAGSGFWAAPEGLASGEYQPATDSVPPVVAELRDWGWID